MVFFSYILWSVMTICSTLLVIQMEIVEYLFSIKHLNRLFDDGLFSFDFSQMAATSWSLSSLAFYVSGRLLWFSCSVTLAKV